MFDKKDLIITFLVFVCLIIAWFPNITSSQTLTEDVTQVVESEYDPWIDINDDGVINIMDIVQVARAYRAEGDPTRKVIVMNSYYEWYSEETIDPHSNWGFLNETAGYRQVNIRMTANATVNVYVFFGILADREHYVTSQDQFEIQKDERVFKTYDVKGSTLQVVFLNLAETTGASVFVAIYITT